MQTRVIEKRGKSILPFHKDIPIKERTPNWKTLPLIGDRDDP